MSIARKSPLRQIESVERVGSWGGYAYVHLLDCGHSIYRKRRESRQIRCIKCFQPPSDFENEADVQVCKVKLASKLGVALDDVNLTIDATNGTLRLQGAVVWLSGEQVRKLVR